MADKTQLRELRKDHKPKSKKEQKKLHIEIVKQMLTLATSGFGLVAALAWNNVVQGFVEGYIKPYLSYGSGMISLILYAVLVTTLAVIITVYLSKVLDRLKD